MPDCVFYNRLNCQRIQPIDHCSFDMQKPIVPVIQIAHIFKGFAKGKSENDTYDRSDILQAAYFHFPVCNQQYCERRKKQQGNIIIRDICH